MDNENLKAKLNEIILGIERHDRINNSDLGTILACLEYTLKNIDYIEKLVVKLKESE